MKVKNLNNSSLKTKKLIRKVFAEMLSEKKELNKVTVTELTRRADISRATFYSHYDDVYAVAEDYENELIEKFFTNERLQASRDYKKFTDDFFAYITENQENYALICRSVSITNVASRIGNLAKSKFYELCNNDAGIVNKEGMEVEISVFMDGVMCQYIRYCRQSTNITIDKLHDFCITWIGDFLKRRSRSPY